MMKSKKQINFYILLGLFFAAIPVLQAQNPVSITPVEDPVFVKRLPEIPWRKPADNTWQTGKPLFTLQSGKSAAKANGWLALTDTHILLAVTVQDPEHQQTKTGNDMWDGDGLQIGLDARGDSTGNMPRQTRKTFGPDDLAFGLALTPEGPQGWVWHGPKNFTGKMPAELVQITRDEKKKQTNYRVSLPLATLETKPGVFPVLGLAVQVNNYSDKSTKEEFYYGQGAGGAPSPGLFKKFRVGPPPADYIGAATVTDEVWQPGQAVSLQVAVAGSQALNLAATAGGQTSQVKIAPTKNKGLQRYRVSLVPQENLPSSTLEVTVRETDKPEILLSHQVQPVVPEVSYRQLQTRLDELLARPNQPELLTRHLRSVKALTQSEWAKVTTQLPHNLPAARETLGYLTDMLKGFHGDAAEWQTYQEGKRALFFTYLSRRDGTLQYYTFMLPKNWEPTKKYPLFLELHGAGNPHALNPLGAHLGYGKNKLDLAGYATPKTYAMIQRNGFYMMPFGRGNTSYEDIGETDVWEAYADVKSNFSIDENRQYLYGFSMGGAGTWVLASRTPDLWAAVGIFGVGRSALDDVTPGIGRNVTNLPVYIWCGDQDIAERRNLSIKIRDEVAAYGNKPEFSFGAGIGHNYPGELQAHSLNWMQQHVRRRPQEFAYLADTKEHTGAWGIKMERDLTVSGIPSFSCKIKGQSVYLETKGTPGLEVDLGPAGLQMNGSVEVYLNGKKSYEGPVKKVKLPVAEASAGKK